MGWKVHDLPQKYQKQILQQLMPKHNEHSIARPVQTSQPQHHQTPALGGTSEGKTKGDARTLVRFIGRRIKPLDPDNFAGGCKDLLDGLRHAGLIPGDRSDQIIFVTEQIKVNHKFEEFTQIELVR